MFALGIIILQACVGNECNNYKLTDVTRQVVGAAIATYCGNVFGEGSIVKCVRVCGRLGGGCVHTASKL